MRIVAQPRDLAELTEIDPAVPPGDGERFSGYGVVGLPFGSGHVLALRRFPASSLGYGYTCVWHRDPEGRWTFWSDHPPDASCARFFGSSVTRVAVAPIRIRWAAPRRLEVVVGEGIIEWSIELVSTPATLLMSAVAAWLPEAAWRQPAILGAMGRIAGPLLRAGRVCLSGRASNGQRFTASSRRVWLVGHSEARVGGAAVGPPGPLARQPLLGDFAIPARGIFVIGQSCFESFDPARHSNVIESGMPVPRAGKAHARPGAEP